jgi:HEAT repeat protein
MAAWTAGILLALGLIWFVAAVVVVPVWQVRKMTDEIRFDFSPPEVQNMVGRLGGQQAAARKVVFFLRLPDRIAPPLHKTRAMLLLALCGGAGVKPLMAQLRNSDDKETRAWAAKALVVSGGFQAVEPLISALSDPEEDVRSAAALSLGRLGDARAIEPLLQALAQARRNDFRAFTGPNDFNSFHYTSELEAFVRALGQLGATCAIPVLTELLKDDSARVHTAAAEALQKIRGEEPKP